MHKSFMTVLSQTIAATMAFMMAAAPAAYAGKARPGDAAFNDCQAARIEFKKVKYIAFRLSCPPKILGVMPGDTLLYRFENAVIDENATLKCERAEDQQLSMSGHNCTQSAVICGKTEPPEDLVLNFRYIIARQDAIQSMCNNPFKK